LNRAAEGAPARLHGLLAATYTAYSPGLLA
jgi:hypothetical protein